MPMLRGDMRAPIRVLVVDDAPALAGWLEGLLPEATGVLVRGPVTDARAAREVRAGRVDLVVVGLTKDGSRTRTVVSKLCQDHDARVLVVPSSSADDVPAALAAGALGVLPDGDAQIVLDAVRRAISGELVLPVEDLSTLVRGIQPPAQTGLERLTEREGEVLALFAEGLGRGRDSARDQHRDRPEPREERAGEARRAFQGGGCAPGPA
jgi:DNA-binding NarL/FixJ family response regulator